MNRHWTLVCAFAIAALALTATGATAQDFGWDRNGGARWQPGPAPGHGPAYRPQPQMTWMRPPCPPPPPVFHRPPVMPPPPPPPMMHRPPMPRWTPPPPPMPTWGAYRWGFEQGFRNGYNQGASNWR